MESKANAGNKANEKRPPVVFDFGGVLIDWNPRYLYRSLFDDDEAMERFLAEVGFAEWNVQQDLGRPFGEAVDALAARFPEYAELIKTFDERWEESVGGAIQGTVAILRSLHRAGHPLYGLSNWSADKFRLVRGRFDFFDLFSDILLSGEVKLIKPDPRIFAQFLHRTGLEASECIFIDDSGANISAAREFGFRTILFESPERLELELRRMGLALPDVNPE